MRACLQKGKDFSPHVLPASERTKPAPALNGTRFPFPLKSGFPSPPRTGFPSPSWKGRERSGASGPPQRSARPGDGRPATGTGREESRHKPPQARARSATGQHKGAAVSAPHGASCAAWTASGGGRPRNGPRAAPTSPALSTNLQGLPKVPGPHLPVSRPIPPEVPPLQNHRATRSASAVSIVRLGHFQAQSPPHVP